MKQKTVVAVIALILGMPLFGFAAEPKFCANDPRVSVKTFCDALAELRDEAKKNPNLKRTDHPTSGILNQLDFTTLTDPGAEVLALAHEVAVERAIQSGAAIAQMYRPDKQTTAPSNASGTTSLVSKAGATDLLSFALDAGALTRTVNGSTATLTGNLDGMFRGLSGYSPLCVYPCKDLGGTTLQWFDRHVFEPVTVSVVTALAQQSSTTAPAAGQASGGTSTSLTNVAIPTGTGKLSGVTARYQILNKYDPHSESFKNNWNKAKQNHPEFVKTLVAANDSILAVRDIATKTATKLDREAIIEAAKTGDAELENFFEQYYQSQIERLKSNANLPSAVSLATQNVALHQQIWEQVRQEAAGTLFTMEYDYNRPVSQPETHDFKIIYGYAPGSVSGMLSLNGTFSLYGGALPVGAKYGRFRAGQLSTQFDRSLSVKSNPNLVMLSLSGYWQYQPNPSVLNIPAGTVAPGTTIPIPNGTQEFVGTAGSLWVTQFKVTLNSRSGINIPIGVKWSNKSDLLSGNKIGAQVGISYDLSSLSTLFGSTTTK